MSITYSEFKNRNIGGRVDVDSFPPGYEYQCWDLAQAYFSQVYDLGFTTLMSWSGGAKDLAEHFSDIFANSPEIKYFANTPDFIPEQGDVVVWDSGFGAGYGHVAIIDSADINSINVLEQNGGQGQGQGLGSDSVRITNRSYANLYGFIRKVSSTPPATEQPELITQPTQPTIMPIPVTQENWDRLLLASYQPHVDYIKGVVNNQDYNLLVHDYTDRYLEKNKLEGENKALKAYALNILLPNKDELLKDYPDLHLMVSNNNLEGIINQNIAFRTIAKDLKVSNDNLVKENNNLKTMLKNTMDKVSTTVSTAVEKFSWNKLFIGLSKNATFVGLISSFTSLLVIYIGKYDPTIAEYSRQIITGLLAFAGISVVGQNITNVAKANGVSADSISNAISLNASQQQQVPIVPKQ